MAAGKASLKARTIHLSLIRLSGTLAYPSSGYSALPACASETTMYLSSYNKHTPLHISVAFTNKSVGFLNNKVFGALQEQT